jgi:hypothetical protein
LAVGDSFIDCIVERWLGDDHPKACLVRLDAPLTVSTTDAGQATKTTGLFVVLRLRYPGDGWTAEGIVEVALCDDDSSNAWNPEFEGTVVETHAKYERLKL